MLSVWRTYSAKKSLLQEMTNRREGTDPINRRPLVPGSETYILGKLIYNEGAITTTHCQYRWTSNHLTNLPPRELTSTHVDQSSSSPALPKVLISPSPTKINEVSLLHLQRYLQSDETLEMLVKIAANIYRRLIASTSSKESRAIFVIQISSCRSSPKMFCGT